MNQSSGSIVEKNDIESLKQLSRAVVFCLENIEMFSAEGKYISEDLTAERMTKEQVNALQISLFAELSAIAFKRPKRLQRMRPKQILKRVKAALPFVVGIYRNGTPDYRFKGMRAADDIPDEIILASFAEEFKARLVKGPAYFVEVQL